MTDKTTHKPGCEALGGYGHGIGPCSCSEAQPEALYVAEQLDATRHAFGDDNAQSKRRASAELRRQHAEIQQLKAQLTTQTNRAAAAEQQITGLTQRLDMANRLNTDARNQLAQLSARQAAPDGWRLVPESPTEEMVTAGQESFGVHDCYYAMLSAAPPPPQREPLSDDQWQALADALDGIINRELKDKISTILQLPTE